MQVQSKPFSAWEQREWSQGVKRSEASTFNAPSYVRLNEHVGIGLTTQGSRVALQDRCRLEPLLSTVKLHSRGTKSSRPSLHIISAQD